MPALGKPCEDVAPTLLIASCAALRLGRRRFKKKSLFTSTTAKASISTSSGRKAWMNATSTFSAIAKAVVHSGKYATKAAVICPVAMAA